MPFICDRCISDEDLKAWVRLHAEAPVCEFCSRRARKRPIAADAELLVAHIAECLGQEFEDAAEMVPYESAEGGYQAHWMTTEELLQDEAGLEPINGAAWEYIVRSLPDYAWVQVDVFSLHPYDTLRYGWQNFAEAVKHKHRYLFFERPTGDLDEFQHDEIRPENMLDALGHVLRNVGLVRTIPAGTRLFRVRAHRSDERPSIFADFGPPPLERAVYANRLSPAGVSMLYTAEDAETAIRETFRPRQRRGHYTVAELELEDEIPIVDLTALPASPGMFTPGTDRNSRAGVHFAHAFARDVSQEVVKDGREHVEYVPTQIVTEYLRYRFASQSDRVVGMRYRSCRMTGGCNVALFASYDDYTEPSYGQKPPVRLRLVGITRYPG